MEQAAASHRQGIGILELLVCARARRLTKEMFLNHLYGGMDEPELKIIDVFVCKLRKKLAAATGGESYIETIWGRGYCCATCQAWSSRRSWRRRARKRSPVSMDSIRKGGPQDRPSVCGYSAKTSPDLKHR